RLPEGFGYQLRDWHTGKYSRGVLQPPRHGQARRHDARRDPAPVRGRRRARRRRKNGYGRLCRIDSISKPSSSGSGCATVFVVASLGIFFAVGSALGYFLSFKPMYLAYASRSWTPIDGEVISSRIESHGSTARPVIRYRYQVGDRSYTSDRYNFIP